MQDDLGESLEKALIGDESEEIAEATKPQPQSLDPGDPVCAPVLVERRRRKTVDLEIDRRLIRIEVIVARNAKTTRLVLVGIGTMLLFATLEYGGIIGDNKTPIWATAVIRGLHFAFGDAQ